MDTYKKVISFSVIVLAAVVGAYFLGKGTVSVGDQSATVFNAVQTHKQYFYTCVNGNTSHTVDNSFSSPSSYTITDLHGRTWNCSLQVLLAGSTSSNDKKLGFFPESISNTPALVGINNSKPEKPIAFSAQGNIVLPVMYRCTNGSSTIDVDVNWGGGSGPSSFTTVSPTGTWNCVSRYINPTPAKPVTSTKQTVTPAIK